MRREIHRFLVFSDNCYIAPSSGVDPSRDSTSVVSPAMALASGEYRSGTRQCLWERAVSVGGIVSRSATGAGVDPREGVGVTVNDPASEAAWEGDGS